MRKMKDSGIKWIGEIPQEWDLLNLKYICQLRTGGTPYNKTGINNEGIGFPWITPQDIGKSLRIKKYSQYISNESIRNSGYILFPARSILLVCIASVGKVGIFYQPCYSNQQITALIPNSKIYPEFLLYFVSSSSDKFLSDASSNVVPIINSTYLKQFLCILPPLQMQQSIATYLDRKCSEIDALTADIQKQIETLEEYKRSVITEAVTKGLDSDVEMKDSGIKFIGAIPTDWEIIKVKYLGEYRNGLTYTPNDLCDKDEGILVLRSSNIKDGKLAFDDNVYVSCPVKENLKVRDGDILICSRNGSRDLVGKNALVNGINATFGAFMMIYRCEYPQYMYYLLNSPVFSYYLGTFFTSTINQLTGANFGNMLIPYCPNKEQQQQIVSYLDRKCFEIDSIISQKKQQLSVLEEYKKSLIFEYVTGKKEVVTETTVTAVDPLLLLIAKILDNVPMNKGKIRVIKLALLSEYLYIPELKTQYYRYPKGAYDVDIDKRLNEINKLGWFDISVNDSPMTWKRGKKYNEFKKQSQQLNQYDDKIIALIKSIGNFKESHLGRISTLFAVWNDFIIDGVPNPSDKQIIQEVVNNWTPNKAKTAESEWKRTLEEMKSKGIIPQGKGLHTKKKGEK